MPPALPTDELAGRYRLLRPLGQGGMATVYLATDQKHGREVAIKVLRPELAEALGRERFVREIQLAAQLTHPNILPLYDSGESHGLLFFVMPVMQGATLRDRLDQGGRLPLDEALRYAAEVAEALDYAHRRDIVHRDIKPENILLHEGHAIVADFGVGKALVAAGPEHATMTQAGMMVGTPAYLSPEQAAGDTLDGRSDLFALGCVLHEMLTGEPAFSGPTLQAVIAKRFMHSPPPVTDARPEVPPALAQVTRRLLEREPAARFATGAEVASALRTPTPMPVAARPAAAPAPDQRSLAVLPFENLSADPESEFFSDGLTEELIADLAGVRALRVTSRASSRQLKGTTKGPREIGALLGVEYVVTGSARRAGNALRVTAQLVEAATDIPRWSEKFSGTLDDVFDVQERVSRAIVAALEVTLSAGESARLAQRPISDARAFELYLKAQELVRRYGAPIDRVLALLDRADAIEGPSLPLRALRIYTQIMQMRAGMRTDAENLAQAEAAAHALVAEAPGAAYGYALLGFIAYERGDLVGAVRGLTRAVELDPSDADALFFLGIARQAAGDVHRALEAAEQLWRVDPLSVMAAIVVAAGQWFIGRFGARLDALEHAMEIDPENPILRWTVGYTHALLGRPDLAAAHAEWMMVHAPGMPYSIHLLALARGMEGRQAEARAALEGLAAMTFDAHLTFHLGESYAMAGLPDVALELVTRGVRNGFHPDAFIREYCPFLAPLRGTPAFARVVAEAEARTAAFHAAIG